MDDNLDKAIHEILAFSAKDVPLSEFIQSLSEKYKIDYDKLVKEFNNYLLGYGEIGN